MWRDRRANRAAVHTRGQHRSEEAPVEARVSALHSLIAQGGFNLHALYISDSAPEDQPFSDINSQDFKPFTTLTY
jgi:hypothetical protein